jgi:protein-S-isoprenylcysteine O-methyltransferase Ste14
VSDALREGIGYADQLVSLFFQSAMLYAIRAIAKETEVRTISDHAIRNFVFLCMYCVAYAVGLFLPEEALRARSVTSGIVWILYLAVILLNLLLIFSAYRWICDEDDVEMEQKPSRFAFVNRFREKNEEKNRKASAEYEAYRLEKKAKRERKRKGGK